MYMGMFWPLYMHTCTYTTLCISSLIPRLCLSLIPRLCLSLIPRLCLSLIPRLCLSLIPRLCQAYEPPSLFLKAYTEFVWILRSTGLKSEQLRDHSSPGACIFLKKLTWETYFPLMTAHALQVVSQYGRDLPQSSGLMTRSQPTLEAPQINKIDN